MGPKEKKKPKLTKAEKEKLKKEEAERKAKEEEEARLKAEQEEREREERERQEREQRRLFEEQERVRHQAEIDELNNQLEVNKKYLYDKRQELLRKQKWGRYMLCDGRPDPISKKEINTFINLLRENVDQFDVEKICKQCELIFELIKELDDHMENIQLDLMFIGEEDIDFVESKEMMKKSFMESKEELQELILHLVDCVTFNMLKTPGTMIDGDTGNISHIETSANIKLCLWGNSAKNPRVKQIEFEKDMFTMELPKQMALAEIALRVLYLKFDNFSRKCSTYMYKPKRVLPKVSIIMSEEAVGENAEEVNAQNELKVNDGLATTSLAPSRMLASKESTKSTKSRIGTGNSTLSTRKVTEASVEQVIAVEEVRSTEDEKQFDLNEETVMIEENVVDLRVFRVLGPLVYVDLLELPYQAKVMNGWTVQQVTPGGLKKIDYASQVNCVSSINLKESSASVIHSNTSSTLGYNLPIMRSFSVDENVLIHETPQVARWEEESQHWKLDGMDDFRYEPDDRMVFFRSKHFGPFAVFQDIYLNMPFNSWYLKPAALNECTIGITGALLKIEINIKNDKCCARFPNNIKRLEYLMNVWLKPQEFIKALRAAGVNFFPFIDGEKYVTICKKEETFAASVYQHMALTASCFTYQHSRWNNDVGEDKIVVKASETIDGNINEGNSGLYMASPRICCRLSMTETDEEFSPDHVPDSQMHPDLYHMLRDGASDKAKTYLHETSVEYIDCVHDILVASNLAMYA